MEATNFLLVLCIFPFFVFASEKANSSNAVVTNKFLHKNGLKEFTVSKNIKGNDCACSCFCATPNSFDAITELRFVSPNDTMLSKLVQAPMRIFQIVKKIRGNICKCSCACNEQKETENANLRRQNSVQEANDSEIQWTETAQTFRSAFPHQSTSPKSDHFESEKLLSSIHGDKAAESELRLSVVKVGLNESQLSMSNNQQESTINAFERSTTSNSTTTPTTTIETPKFTISIETTTPNLALSKDTISDTSISPNTIITATTSISTSISMATNSDPQLEKTTTKSITPNTATTTVNTSVIRTSTISPPQLTRNSTSSLIESLNEFDKSLVESPPPIVKSFDATQQHQTVTATTTIDPTDAVMDAAFKAKVANLLNRLKMQLNRLRAEEKQRMEAKEHKMEREKEKKEKAAAAAILNNGSSENAVTFANDKDAVLLLDKAIGKWETKKGDNKTATTDKSSNNNGSSETSEMIMKPSIDNWTTTEGTNGTTKVDKESGSNNLTTVIEGNNGTTVTATNDTVKLAKIEDEKNITMTEQQLTAAAGGDNITTVDNGKATTEAAAADKAQATANKFVLENDFNSLAVTKIANANANNILSMVTVGYSARDNSTDNNNELTNFNISTILEESSKFNTSTVTENSDKFNISTVAEEPEPVKFNISTVTENSDKFNISTVTENSDKFNISTVTEEPEPVKFNISKKEMNKNVLPEKMDKFNFSTLPQGTVKFNVSMEKSGKLNISTVTEEPEPVKFNISKEEMNKSVSPEKMDKFNVSILPEESGKFNVSMEKSDKFNISTVTEEPSKEEMNKNVSPEKMDNFNISTVTEIATASETSFSPAFKARVANLLNQLKEQLNKMRELQRQSNAMVKNLKYGKSTNDEIPPISTTTEIEERSKGDGGLHQSQNETNDKLSNSNNSTEKQTLNETEINEFSSFITEAPADIQFMEAEKVVKMASSMKFLQKVPFSNSNKIGKKSRHHNRTKASNDDKLFPLPNDFLIDLPPTKDENNAIGDDRRARVILLPAPPKGREFFLSKPLPILETSETSQNKSEIANNTFADSAKDFLMSNFTTLSLPDNPKTTTTIPILNASTKKMLPAMPLMIERLEFARKLREEQVKLEMLEAIRREQLGTDDSEPLFEQRRREIENKLAQLAQSERIHREMLAHNQQQQQRQQQQQQTAIDEGIARFQHSSLPSATSAPKTMPCETMRRFIRWFRVVNPQEWIQQNCQLAKRHFPSASCVQIETLLSKCIQ